MRAGLSSRPTTPAPHPHLGGYAPPAVFARIIDDSLNDDSPDVQTDELGTDDGTLTDLNNEVAEHVHDIALPIDNAADDLHCVTPMTVEDAKYDPPRLSVSFSQLPVYTTLTQTPSSQTQIEEMTIETIPAFDFDFLE